MTDELTAEQLAHRTRAEALMDALYAHWTPGASEPTPGFMEAREAYDREVAKADPSWPCHVVDPERYQFLSDFHKSVRGFRYRGDCTAAEALALIETLRKENPDAA